ncbi:hypothetical protein ACGE24_01020 [Corynebacterium kroppenstedtii]|uniref:YkvI family membrane protein n=1 Tax=Corynebacterium sp. PCR 32 TaxID=3351342 RepID=UPI0030AFB1C2
MFRSTLSIALAFVGLIVGAGTASGQEGLQFFVAFGRWGICGVVLAAVLMSIAGTSVFVLGSYYRAHEHKRVIDSSATKLLAVFLDMGILITLFSLGFVMFAGAGSNFHQQFGLPTWVGSTMMLVLVITTGMLDVDKVSTIIGAITPFIIVCVTIIGVTTLLSSHSDINHLDAASSTIHTHLPSWWMSSLNYVGFNLICGVSMAIVIGGSYFYPRQAGLGGGVGGLIFGFLLIVIAFSLYMNVDDIKDKDLPMLALASDISPLFGLCMSVVIYGMIFNTALGVFYALSRRVCAHDENRFRLTLIATALVAYVISFLGFRALVSNVYPILGYVGVLLMVVLVYSWATSRRKIVEEGKRRRRLRELVNRKLDPTKRFTSKQKREVRHLIDESNIDDDVLREILDHNDVSR